MINNTCKKVS